MARKEPTIARILQDLAGEFASMVPEREVYDRVLARRPSRAKDPYGAIRNQLRFDAPRLGWVYLGGGELMPLRAALEGLRFRVIPSEVEIALGALMWSGLRPFVPSRTVETRIETIDGTVLNTQEVLLHTGEGPFGPMTEPAIALDGWFERVGLRQGDSVLVTISRYNPLTLQIEYEPASAFRIDEVISYERALLDALAEVVSKNQRGPVMVETSVLPIYARAAWRTSYPGRPWQMLVEQDRRIRFIHSEMIADGRYRSPFDFTASDEVYDAETEALDEELRGQISVIQEQMRASRRAAVEREIWDGIAPRVSTAQTMFDFEEGTSTTVYPGAVDALEDHTAVIEEHIANGDYEDEEDDGSWLPDDEAEFGFALEDDDDNYDEELDNIVGIDDIQMFIDHNPEVAAATRRLMESLTPEEQRRLDNARSIEDVQQILAPRLPELLRTEPALWVPLEPSMFEYHDVNGNGNGHSDGNDNGHRPGVDIDLLAEDGWEDDPGPLQGGDWLDGDGFEQGAVEGIPGIGGDSEAALERSNALIEQFVASQIGAGRSKATASSRASDLWLYADFLSRYYGRSLDRGDYATLDECLFFFYPRKVLNSTPRNVRDMCTSLKQFYGFLKAESIIDDDGFAQAIWQRRDQAARVVEIYDQLDGESSQFERLFAHLFAPYTA